MTYIRYFKYAFHYIAICKSICLNNLVNIHKNYTEKKEETLMINLIHYIWIASRDKYR